MILFFASVFIRNGKFMAPFCSAARQNLAAIGGRHALSKTMYALTTALVRLICAFFSRHLSKFCSIKKYFFTGHHPCWM